MSDGAHPPVGQSEALGVLPGGFFGKRLLTGLPSGVPKISVTAVTIDLPVGDRGILYAYHEGELVAALREIPGYDHIDGGPLDQTTAYVAHFVPGELSAQQLVDAVGVALGKASRIATDRRGWLARVQDSATGLVP